MLVFEDVTFRYPSQDAATPALAGVSLTLEPGRVLVVLGANGSGKSTLVKLANGLELPLAGRVLVDGIDTGDASSTYEVRRRVGVVFQRPDDQIVATTVEDDVAFGPENLGLTRPEIRSRVDEAIAAVGLSGLESREPHTLSGGQKQRLAIAGALAMRPRYLVLDEPTSMLDPAGAAEARAIAGRLRDAGHGVLLVTHDLSEATLADAAMVLDRGRVVFAGLVPELFADAERLGEWALSVPPITEFVTGLARRGFAVGPGVLDPLEIAKSLCR